MRNDLLAVTRRICATLSAAALAGFAGCAPPLFIDAPPTVNPRAAKAENAASQPATVQLRYFWYSPDVAVVAWVPEENGYGLRSVLRRDGSLVRDHWIFVSSYYDPGMPAARKAVLDTRVLLLTGTSGDRDRCWFGDCSPPLYFAARIPDEVLRTRRDSVSVRFYNAEGREVIVTLQPALVEAYIATVDSVSASLRRQRSR